jgi:hypothetical protein
MSILTGIHNRSSNYVKILKDFTKGDMQGMIYAASLSPILFF